MRLIVRIISNVVQRQNMPKSNATNDHYSNCSEHFSGRAADLHFFQRTSRSLLYTLNEMCLSPEESILFSVFVIFMRKLSTFYPLGMKKEKN